MHGTGALADDLRANFGVGLGPQDVKREQCIVGSLRSVICALRLHVDDVTTRRRSAGSIHVKCGN
jgi:hypothetical protein